MKEKATTEKHTAYDPGKTLSDMFVQATKHYENAVRNSLKLQEEATRCCETALSQVPTIADLQKRFNELTKLATGVLPASKRQVTALFELAEKNSRVNSELFGKAMEVAQTPSMTDKYAKWIDLWTGSWNAARTNAEELNKVAGEAIDSCIECFRKNSEAFEVRPAKAA